MTPRKKESKEKRCLYWYGLLSGIYVGALRLQVSLPDGAKLLKFKIAPTVGHFIGSEPSMSFN